MNLQNIPIEIQKLNQWVCSRSDSKCPMQANKPKPASSVNSATWSTFADAVDSLADGIYEYIGFVFNNNGIIGIDIDDGYDADGFLSRLAVDIIAACGSYTEKSKSGSGVHILVKGDIPFKGKNNLKGVEIYKTARYFITTGDVLVYDTIIENQKALDYIVEKYFPETRDADSSRVLNSRIYTPQWQRPDKTIQLRPMYPTIPNGCRNICLTSLAGMLHTLGYKQKQIYDEIAYCNTVACKPPLNNREVENIVKSVTRYKR